MLQSILDGIKDFIVEFLGALVPGILFLTGTFLSITVPLLFLLQNNKDYSNAPQLLSFHDIPIIIDLSLKITSSTTIVSLTIFILIILSYYLGQIFYRQDPKTPDKISFKKLAKSKGNTQRKEDLACDNRNNCDFPYPHLSEYLKKRGLLHLQCFVLWDNIKEFRTKNLINVIKIRLNHHFPDKCAIINKNEAHVRLMSSNWHVAKILRRISAIGIIIYLIPIIIFASHNSQEYSKILPAIINTLIILLFPLSTLVISLTSMRGVTNCLHYQRLREVIFVLETAYTSFNDKPEMLQDVFPDYMK